MKKYLYSALVFLFASCICVFLYLSYKNGQNSDHSLIPHATIKEANSQASELTTIIKGANDKRDYQHFELENGLRGVLIHDKDSDRAKACLTVQVGGAFDPSNIPGLAHFLEHMLFMGTEKYPTESEYKAFVAKHGGFTNALTTLGYTQYVFEIPEAFFEEALDRFSQFFIAPLFDESCIEREREAVQAEYEMQRDTFAFSVLCINVALHNPAHPSTKFLWGNRTTLSPEGVNVREALIDFYNKYYSSDLMNLVISSSHSLKQMHEWVSAKFSGVKKIASSQDIIFWKSIPMFVPSIFGKIIRIENNHNANCIVLNWRIPDQTSHYKSQPLASVNQLFTSQQKGTLFNVLNKKKWITSLFIAPVSSLPFSDNIYTMAFDLTKSGMENYEEIIKMVFYYIELIKKASPCEFIFEEVQNALDVEFRKPTIAIDLARVMQISASMHKYDPKDIVRGDRIIQTYNPTLIMETVKELNPDNLYVTLYEDHSETNYGWIKKVFGTRYKIVYYWIDKLFGFGYRIIYGWINKVLGFRHKIDYNLTEIRSGTRYRIDSFDSIFLKTLGSPFDYSEMHLLQPRGFICTTTPAQEIKSTSLPKISQLIINNSEMRVWRRANDQFSTCEPQIWVALRSNLDFSLPINTAKCKIFASAIKNALIRDFQDEINEGIFCSVEAEPIALDIKIRGQPGLLNIVMEKAILYIRNFALDQENFAEVSQACVKEFKESKNKEPYISGIIFLNKCMSNQPFVSDKDVREAFGTLTLNDMTNFSQEYLKSTFVEALILGNISSEEARDWSNIMRQALRNNWIDLSLGPQAPRKSCDLALSGNSVIQKFTDSDNSSICIYLQLMWLNDKSFGEDLCQVYTGLLAHIMAPRFYHQLRTVEQLGYIVECSKSGGILDSPTLFFVIQSKRSLFYLYSRIENFLNVYFKKTLEELSDEEFEKNVNGFSSILLKKNSGLKEEMDTLVSFITSGTYNFEGGQRYDAILKKTTKQQLVQFYRARVLDQKRSLTILVRSKNSVAEEEACPFKEILGEEDVPSWRARMRSFPEPESHVSLEVAKSDTRI